MLFISNIEKQKLNYSLDNKDNSNHTDTSEAVEYTNQFSV